MHTNDWFPRSIRNRLAMLMGFISLVLFISWNLMPYPATPSGMMKVEMDITAIEFWPKLVSHTILMTKIFRADIESILYLVFLIDLYILALFAVVVLPIWKILQSSFLLRLLPAALMLIGFTLSFYYLIISSDAIYITLYIYITLNFLTTAIALLLFKNESLEAPHAI